VHTDASGFATGAVLQQDRGKGLQPVAYLSKKMLDAETRYPVHEQELLAIIVALKAWRHYLMGPKFRITVKTDHKSLQHFVTQPQLSSRQVRWQEILADYNFTIEHVDGTANVVADGLSRRVDHQGPRELVAQAIALFTEENAPPHRISAATTLFCDIKDAYAKDPAYQTELKKRRTRADPIQVKDGGFLYFKDRLYIPNDLALQTRILQECHDAPTGGHLGKDKTIEQVKRRFYWPGMDKTIVAYVTTCDACQRNKPSQQSPMGPLMPLPIPESPWQWVSLDLITNLPRSRNGNDAIVVFVCRLTKMVHYVATTTNVTAPQLATLFMREVVRLHGVPQAILSDRDPRFTAHFWRAFWTQLGTTLTMSTAYHPQTDGQTERANRTLEEMLRSRINFAQTDWDEHLSIAELAVNNAQQASTGFTPFYLNYGKEVELPLDRAIAELRPTNNPEAAARIRKLHADLALAHENLEGAQQRQARYANQHRRDVTFKVGDQVLLSTEHLKMLGSERRTPKFTFRYLGPFKIKRVVNANSYELDLPPTMKIHPTLNIDRLKPYRDGRLAFPHRPPAESRPPPDATLENGAAQFLVESILAKMGEGSRAKYLVKWLGYPNWESTWEPASALRDAADAVAEYESQLAARDLNSVRVVPHSRHLDHGNVKGQLHRRPSGWMLNHIALKADSQPSATTAAHLSRSQPLALASTMFRREGGWTEREGVQAPVRVPLEGARPTSRHEHQPQGTSTKSPRWDARFQGPGGNVVEDHPTPCSNPNTTNTLKIHTLSTGSLEENPNRTKNDLNLKGFCSTGALHPLTPSVRHLPPLARLKLAPRRRLRRCCSSTEGNERRTALLPLLSQRPLNSRTRQGQIEHVSLWP
jgi:hypothetical protein